MRDPLDPRPDVHDFDACLARASARMKHAQELGAVLFSEEQDTSDAAAQVLDAAVHALAEARVAVEQAALRRRLRAGFGDVAGLEPAELRHALELVETPTLVVHVDRRAQLHVGEGGLAQWTLTRDMSDAALCSAVAEMKEHLPDFLKSV